MIGMSGYKPYKDIDIVEIGLRPGEKMFEELKLDGETTTRTKNNLIFKNNVMSITKEDVTEKLQQLDEVLREDIPNSVIKERLLNLIISDKDQGKANSNQLRCLSTWIGISLCDRQSL